MLGSTGQGSFRQTVFTFFVLIIFATSALEIIFEFAEGESYGAMGDDLWRFVLSAVVLGIFVLGYRRQNRQLKNLKAELNKTRGRLASLDGSSPALANQYRAVMQKQFEAWRLSVSEQDIVIGMLKGLSFREIASLRQTREKTVRQQASNIYRKAGVASRNELTAWFFEDMLDPLPLVEAPAR